jgi:hypothetical protein
MEAKWITTIPIANSTSMSDNGFCTCATHRTVVPLAFALWRLQQCHDR